MNPQINPLVKGICFLISTVASFLASNIFLLLAVWGVVLFLFVQLNKLALHIKFVIWAILPVFFILFLIWGVIIGEAPSNVGSAYLDGKLYAIFISLRLVVIGGIFQLTFLSISQEELITHFKAWGFKGNSLIIMLGAFSVFPDLVEKSRKILTARFARGLIKDRTFFSRVKQLPLILKPLIIDVFSSAIERNETWADKQMIKRLNYDVQGIRKLYFRDMLLIFFVISYLITSIFILLY